MPAAWKDFPEDCPECGETSQIFTILDEEGSGYDGDPVRCPACGCHGYWSGDEPDNFYVNWDA
jgi:endogenous inhibitor of DNA gyrase (YacG/DUF329 family)